MRTSLIQNYMPDYRMRQVDRIRVKASPEVVWRVVRALDIQESTFSRLLFALRTLPEMLAGKSKPPESIKPKASGIEGFTGPGKGFQILAEEPGREIVIGSVGKFWKLNIEWANITSQSFKGFNDPGYGKLVWNLRVDPDAHGGSWITWELRVTATDEPTWQFFKRYWFVIGKFSHWLRKSALSRFCRKLGGSPSEETFRLLGDELVPHPKYQKTMSTTIEAPPNQVWPWLAQMGCQRGGRYSIDRLDNGGEPSAQQIISELQKTHVGQVLPWKPKGNEGFTVLQTQANEALVLGTPSLLQGPHNKGSDFDDTWAFVLEPIGTDATRLITRVRADYQPSWGMTFLGAWLRPAHLIMERAQLVNLKRRIESAARSSLILLQEAPRAQFRSQVTIDVNAPPELIIQKFDQVTPKEMPMAWLLGEIRYLPAKLLGRSQPPIGQNEPFAKRLMESGSLVLHSSPGETVIASVGKYHQILDQEFVHLKNADEFRSFTDPRYQKLLISVRAEPKDSQTSKLILEHWTWALSDRSRKQFSPYWRIIRPTGNFVSLQLLKAVKRRAETSALAAKDQRHLGQPLSPEEALWNQQ